mgnify:CR=1 FL=1
MNSYSTFFVADEETGEVKIEKKFYKSDFDDLLKTSKYSLYLEDLIADAFIKKMSSKDEINIDEESYEEVRAISLELEESLADLET